MIKPITKQTKNDLIVVDELTTTTLVLVNKINEIIEHINGEPDIDEQIEKNECDKPADDDRSEMFVRKHYWTLIKEDDTQYFFVPTKRDEPDEQIEKNEKCNHPDCMICNECDEPMKPAGDVCKAHLDRTDAAYDEFDARSYNIKLWTRDMRKMIKGKNISPKLKDDIRRKLNDLEEI